jgi:hypothetical protein
LELDAPGCEAMPAGVAGVGVGAASGRSCRCGGVEAPPAGAAGTTGGSDDFGP